MQAVLGKAGTRGSYPKTMDTIPEAYSVLEDSLKFSPTSAVSNSRFDLFCNGSAWRTWGVNKEDEFK